MATQLNLFSLPEIEVKNSLKTEYTCGQCMFITALEYGAGKRFFYCTKQKCNRSQLKIKKIKARDQSCIIFQKVG